MKALYRLLASLVPMALAVSGSSRAQQNPEVMQMDVKGNTVRIGAAPAPAADGPRRVGLGAYLQ